LDDITAIERSMAPVGPQDRRRTVDVDRMASPAPHRDHPGWARRLLGWLWSRPPAATARRAAPRRAVDPVEVALAALIEPAADVAHAPRAFDAADARLIRALEPLVARADIATSGFRPAVGRVGELLALDDQDVNGAVRAVLREPAVVAAVLTMANSPEFRRGVAVAEVRTAVERLGVELVRQLALGIAARALHEPDPMAASPGRRERGDQIVHRALTTAFAVAWYGQNRGLHAADVAYVAALFLDVGRTAAYDALARLEHAGGSPPIGDRVAEEVVDRAHARLGAAALTAWGLPDEIAVLCAHHHDDQLADELDQPDAHAVRVLSGLVHLRAGEPATAALRSSALALGLDRYALRALAGVIDDLAPRAAVILGVPDRGPAWPTSRAPSSAAPAAAA
jgi:HD-like signal output (HDOD) protein